MNKGAMATTCKNCGMKYIDNGPISHSCPPKEEHVCHPHFCQFGCAVTTPEAAPCPFCGCKSVIWNIGESQRRGGYMPVKTYQRLCDKCRAGTALYPSPDQATQAWNQRPNS